MRNIWVYIVGAILILGGGIALYNGISGSSPHIAANTQQPAHQTAAARTTSAPEPDKTFSNIEVSENELIVGRADAPITIIEYASLTCPHCANFHQKVLPTIKKEYIDTGKARLVYRDFPLDRWALAASMVARCAGPERRYSFIEAFFAQQDSWTRADAPGEALAKIAQLGGIDRAAFDRCVANESGADTVLQERAKGTELFSVESTPTVIINGDRYSGGLTVDEMRAVLNAKLK